MSAELIALDPEPVAADVIDTLERMLERARAGEISSVAIAAVYRDGATTSTWSAQPSFATLLGAVHHMAFRLSHLRETGA